MSHTPTHTPTPWGYTGNKEWATIYQVETHEHIAAIMTKVSKKENAAHIVHCVNVHDQLVAALRQISEGNVMGEMGDKPYTHADVVHAYTRIATNALAAAEKGA